MRVAMRKQHRVACIQQHRRLTLQLNVTLALRNEVKDHDPLGAWLEQRCGRIRTRGPVAPGSGKSGVYENGAYQTHDAQSFG